MKSSKIQSKSIQLSHFQSFQPPNGRAANKERVKFDMKKVKAGIGEDFLGRKHHHITNNTSWI